MQDKHPYGFTLLIIIINLYCILFFTFDLTQMVRVWFLNEHLIV